MILNIILTNCFLRITFSLFKRISAFTTITLRWPSATRAWWWTIYQIINKSPKILAILIQDDVKAEVNVPVGQEPRQVVPSRSSPDRQLRQAVALVQVTQGAWQATIVMIKVNSGMYGCNWEWMCCRRSQEGRLLGIESRRSSIPAGSLCIQCC